jgi:geranylgeranyl pyrophosphate synthase
MNPASATASLLEMKAAVEAGLERLLEGESRLSEALRYAVLTGGKRFRPLLLLSAGEAFGGVRATLLPYACAVELIHSYSLVHDDLPCMDDDELRRGRPTAHRAYGVEVATDAGFRMVPLAARIIASGGARLGLDPRRQGDIARVLLAAAGAGGMIGGQMLDLEAEGAALDRRELFAVHAAKTGAMIGASAEIGALAAGVEPGRTAAARAFGRELGLAFQILDDVLDVAESSERLGKTAGKDARQRKATSVSVLGEAAARVEAEERLASAIAQLRAARLDSHVLRGLARFVVDRRS